MNNDEVIAKLTDNAKLAQFNLDDDYQRCILSLLIADRQFLMENVDLIQPTYFKNDTHKLICRIVFDYYDEYKNIPNNIIIKQAIRDKLKDEVKVLLNNVELALLYDHYIPGLDAREALQNRVLKFAKTQALRVAFRKSFDLLTKDFESDETWVQIQEIYREAILVDRKHDLGLNYFEDIDERYERMMQEVVNAERFTSGFDTIDNSLTGGGMRRGEIYAWMGLSGTGKSLALVTAAIKNLVLGKKVLYISCEMSRDEIAERFDAQFANEAIWQIYDRKDTVIAAIKEHVVDMEDKRQLVITDFPAGSADVNQFRSHIARLKMDGFTPDIVIVDYIGEMKDVPGLKTYESRFRIVRDLKGFAREEGFLCLTAMQPNRSARELQEDPTKYIDDDNLADAFGQTRPLDGLWSINQGLKEKKASVARGFIVKSRRGKSRIEFLICYDERTLRMFEISKEMYRNRMSLVTQADADKTGEHFNDVAGD
jgi:replicative DNA helicase